MRANGRGAEARRKAVSGGRKSLSCESLGHL